MADKWGRRLFMAGAAALILLALVHSVSLFTKQVPANQTEQQLLDLMSNYRFNIMGSQRSMSQFLRGFSISFALAPLGLGLLDLVLCGERAALLRKVALVNAIWLAALTAVSLHYFFLAPTSLLAATMVIFALAWVKLPAAQSG